MIEPWKPVCTNDEAVHAHGGQILREKEYWYFIGEDRRGSARVSIYRSSNFKIWKKIYTISSKTFPPYLLGRIATRFFFMSQKINTELDKNLGDLMYYSVISFLNTCLVIEGQEYLKNNITDQSNHKVVPNVFYNNLKKIKNSNTNNEMSLTLWLIKCPLLQAFINIETDKDKETDEIALKEYYAPNLKNYNIYNILKEIKLENS